MDSESLRLQPEDEQMPRYKVVYLSTNEMISTFTDYAGSADEMVRHVLLKMGYQIKRFTEIIKLDSQTGEIVDFDADIGMYNRWLNKYVKSAYAFILGWGIACASAAKMAHGIGEPKLSERLLDLARNPDIKFLFSPMDFNDALLASLNKKIAEYF